MYNLLDKRSQLAGKTEIDLFSVPATQVAIERAFWEEIHLKHTLTDSGPFEFHIPAQPQYLDFTKNYLYIELDIVTSNGSQISNLFDENNALLVGPINLLGKTLFKQVKVYLNNKTCFDSGDTYAFVSYVETELNYGSDAKRTHLLTSLYARDDYMKMNTLQNTGLVKRSSRFGMGGTVQIMSPIQCDIFNQEKLMLSHTDLRIELHRNTDDFCLMSEENNYKISMKKLSWFVRKVDIASSLALSIENFLTKSSAKYPIRRVLCKTFNIDRNSQDTPHLIVSNGQVPRRLIVTFVDRKAFFGNFNLNPFCFMPYNLREITVTTGGFTFPKTPIELNFTTGKYVHGYVNLLEALGLAQMDRGNSLTLNEFANGYFFHAVDLTADNNDGLAWDLIQEGTCTVRVIFREVLQNDIKMLCFLEYDNLLTIDKNRNVFLDFTT